MGSKSRAEVPMASLDQHKKLRPLNGRSQNPKTEEKGGAKATQDSNRTLRLRAHANRIVVPSKAVKTCKRFRRKGTWKKNLGGEKKEREKDRKGAILQVIKVCRLGGEVKGNACRGPEGKLNPRTSPS